MSTQKIELTWLNKDKDTDLDFICKEMGKALDWAAGLVLRADGYETPCYKKA